MICVPLKERNLKTLIINFKKAQKVADLTEIWFDRLKEKDFKKIFFFKSKPIIYKYTGNSRTLEKVLKFPIDYIDFDISTDYEMLSQIRKKCPNIKIIISLHDFDKTPNQKELYFILKKMLKKKPDIVKIATHAQNFTDSLRILEFLSELKVKNIPAICLAMGKQGAVTRLAGHLFGNYLMYSPMSANSKTADGQIPLKQLRKIWA